MSTPNIEVIEVPYIEVQWQRTPDQLLLVQCHYVTRDGWEFSFYDQTNSQLKWTEELDQQFNEAVGGTNIGAYMANVAGGDGKW